MPRPVEDTVLTYRLRSADLRDYLQYLFGREVRVTSSADGKTYYKFKIPRKLSEEEKDYIYDNLRYARPEDDVFGDR